MLESVIHGVGNLCFVTQEALKRACSSSMQPLKGTKNDRYGIGNVLFVTKGFVLSRKFIDTRAPKRYRVTRTLDFDP